jgi:hypothetical protein
MSRVWRWVATPAWGGAVIGAAVYALGSPELFQQVEPLLPVNTLAAQDNWFLLGCLAVLWLGVVLTLGLAFARGVEHAPGHAGRWVWLFVGLFLAGVLHAGDNGPIRACGLAALFAAALVNQAFGSYAWLAKEMWPGADGASPDIVGDFKAQIAVIEQLQEQVAEYAAANVKWQEAYDALAARNSGALPEKHWATLQNVITHELSVKALLAALHPDRAKNGDPKQRRMREEMTKRVVELIDYVKRNKKD